MEKTMRVQSVEGRNRRTIAASLLPGDDMLEGIEHVCREHNVLYGVIFCCIGCLDKATFVLPVPKEDAKIGIVYCDPIEIHGPVEFLGSQGRQVLFSLVRRDS